MPTTSRPAYRTGDWCNQLQAARVLDCDYHRLPEIAEAGGVQTRRLPRCKRRQWCRASLERLARECIEQPATTAG